MPKRKTFYVEMLYWIEAYSEKDAQAIAKHVANAAETLVRDPSWGGKITSATVNTVEEQES